MTRLALSGFHYDAKRKRLVLDGYVAGTRTRRQKTIGEVTRDQALVAWKSFRADLASGRAIEGPGTLAQFVAEHLALIAAGHSPGTRKTQGVLHPQASPPLLRRHPPRGDYDHQGLLSTLVDLALAA